MKSKKCNKCEKTKSFDEFGKDKTRKDGYAVYCKKCRSKYRKKHKEKIAKYNKVYHKEHRKELLIKDKIYREEHKEEIIEYGKEYRKKHKEKIAEYDKTYREGHKKEKAKYNKIYCAEHKEKIAEQKKQYCKKHRKEKAKYDKTYRTKHKEKINERNRNRKKNDINYKLACNLRVRLNQALKNNQKVGSAVRDLGCSISDFKIYLENRFYPNKHTKAQMTWNNYGKDGWHIDHIIPLSSFDLTDRDQFLEACNYTNLQPLWAEENLSKGIKRNSK